MSCGGIREFRYIWLVDFEFYQPDGDRPTPICMVAQEFHTGRTLRLLADQLETMASPPFSTEHDTLFVAYYASAELGCFLALDWPMPTRILDLYVEFRNLTNGLQPLCGMGVTSLIMFTSSPAACKERIAASRPAPGPLTYTSTCFMP